MSRESALITGAELVSHTGVQDLQNLAQDGELVLNTFVTAAHRTIYDELRVQGIDPARLENEAELKSCVAWEAVYELALSDYLERAHAEGYREEVKRRLRIFVPRYVAAAEKPPAPAPIAVSGNVDVGSVFGPRDHRDPWRQP
jgi:hypothetical protein